jgi:photosystem II stability/assembly factor-like uncharacterized protein
MYRRAAALFFLSRIASVLIAGLLVQPGGAAEPITFNPKLLDALPARSIGPANMGGRITDLAVVESKSSTMYLATASGGLWKTVNNGTTWKPVFDQEQTVSLGAVAVAASNPDIVWVGTGEANARNSVSWGDGVYKSTDGGKSWTHVGLQESRHIGRIVIHPTNPDIVYVAALGHLWGPNKERGLYRTIDGGKTWKAVKTIDADTGFIDVVMDPSDPNTVYAAAYRVRRDPFSGGNPAVQFGPGSGLYKTEDGGESWQRLSAGLPDRPLGRCGLAVYHKDPRIVFAVIQTDKTSTSVAGQGPKKSDKVELGGVFRSADKGKTWTKLNDLCPRPFYYGQIRIDPNDDRRIYVLGIALHVSTDGGQTFSGGNRAAGAHPDHHALWIDPHDSDHLVLGNDGGLYFSYDRGATWEHVANLPIGQFYAAGVDMRKPYRVYGGLQDNGSWGGPTATQNFEGITNADWYRVMGADGFYCQIDPTDPDTVYAEGQYGMLRRINIRTGDSVDIRPRPPMGAPAYRFNWNSPILLSPNNPRTLYYGGNHLFRSVKRGSEWETVSPDLTNGKPGPSENTGHTITTIAESPLRPGLLYAGTDDGRVHISRNGGAEWTDLSGKISGVATERWITRIECSHFAAGTAYLTVDRHRHDDQAPYVFKTTDYGATWLPLANDLPPDGPLHVIREDPRNQDLLYVGTEFGLFLSVDGGRQWHRFRNGLPTVAVNDVVVHPRDRELVIATHGRSIYVMDVAPLQALTPKVLAADAHLFEVKPATRFSYRGSHGWDGAKIFAGANPPYGAVIYYYLKTAAEKPVRISIADALGNSVAELQGAKEPGLHRLVWNLRVAVPVGPSGSLRPGPPASPGDYAARLKIGDRVLVQRIRVEAED